MPAPTLASGKLDPSYGANGKVVLVSAAASSFTVDAAGTAYVPTVPFRKIDADGRSFDFTSVSGYSPALDEAGNIYVLSALDRAVVKVDATGAPVTTFGTAGKVQVESADNPYPSNFHALLRDREGNLFVVAVRNAPHYSGGQVFIIKIDTTGRLVFNKTQSLRVDPLGAGYLRMGVLDSHGNILVVTDGAFPSGISVVAKFDGNANPAVEFGDGGVWVAPACAKLVTLATDEADNVFAGGSCGARAVIYKLDARGAPVLSFGSSGAAADVLGPVTSAIGALRAGGRGVYASGSIEASQCRETAVTRLDESGIRITSFGTNGIERLGVGTAELFPMTLAIDAAGRLYVGATNPASCPWGAGIPTSYVVSRLGG